MAQNMKEIQQAAQLLQRESEKAYKQGAADTLKDIKSKLQTPYEKSLNTYEALELLTFDSDYDEDYEDTVTRLYEQGFSDALLMVIKQLEKGNN